MRRDARRTLSPVRSRSTRYFSAILLIRRDHRAKLAACDNKGTTRSGLIAEEVAEINPNLVIRDHDGAIYGARYDAINAKLLNQFLNKHRKVEEQAGTIARAENAIDTVLSRLDEHDSRRE
jgi:hypothetical protein